MFVSRHACIVMRFINTNYCSLIINHLGNVIHDVQLCLPFGECGNLKVSIATTVAYVYILEVDTAQE